LIFARIQTKTITFTHIQTITEEKKTRQEEKKNGYKDVLAAVIIG
jgi:hypothetical protein